MKNRKVARDKVACVFTEAELLSAARGESETVSPCLAMKQLMNLDSKFNIKFVQQLLEDQSKTLEIRLSAALELGTKRSPENQTILLNNLHTDNEILFKALARSLGRIGDERALENLSVYAERWPRNDTVLFARRCIAYRLGIEVEPFADIPADDLLEVSADRVVSFVHKEADRELIEEACRDTKRQIPTVSLSAIGSVQVFCGNAVFILAFNRSYLEPECLESLLLQKAMPMVLLKRVNPRSVFTVECCFFTHPGEGDKTLVMIGAKSNGTVAYSGWVRFHGNRWQYGVRTTKKGYLAPLDIEGFYDPKARSNVLIRAIGQMNLDRAACPVITPTAAARSPIPLPPRQED